MSKGSNARRFLCVRKRRLRDHFEKMKLPYTAEPIDRETVLYRHLNNYDIEISGGSHKRPFYIYVWALWKKRAPMYIESAYTIPSKDIASAATEIHAIAEEYIRRPAHELH